MKELVKNEQYVNKNIAELFEHFAINIQNRGMNEAECRKKLNSYSGNIFLYGCGNTGTSFYKQLQKQKIDIKGFIDNGDSAYKKTYMIYNNYQLLEYLKGREGKYLIIVTLLDIKEYYIIKEKLEDYLGGVNCTVEILYFTQFRAYTDLFVNSENKSVYSAYCGENVDLLLLNRENIEKVYECLKDDISKISYLELLNWFIASDFCAFTIFPYDELYFEYDLYKKSEREIFVDCGAYVGDTFEIFINNQKGKYEKYYALEADELNIKKIKEKEGENIEIVRCYLSSSKREIHFSGEGKSYSRLDEDAQNSIMSITLDELFDEQIKKGEGVPTFVKICVEGVEVDTLNGAGNLIEQGAPILAIQGHHKMADLWEIVQTIQKFDKCGYQFFFRNYNGIYGYAFYAIPPKRAKIRL